MPKLARYFSQPNPRTAQIPLSAANTGAGQVGQALQQTGEVLAGQAARDDNFWVQKTASDLAAKADREWQTATENVKPGADGFERSYISSLDKHYGKARTEAPSPRAGKALDLIILRQRNSRQNRATGFEKTEKFNHRKRSTLREADNLSQHVLRENGAPPYSPHGSLVPPGTLESEESGVVRDGFYEALPPQKGNPHLGFHIPDWKSPFYVPRDFADGEVQGDKSGAVKISRTLVDRLDWVTEQFGHGKLNIISGYRSSETNKKRAETGAHGPHTRGSSIDIDVSDLSQGERDRLYSLLKAQGFNSFGFGRGALHAEIRKGTGKGRGGDYEWTYQGSKKYSLVPVMKGSRATTGTRWKTPNQYPYLANAQLTARAETGSGNLLTASSTIARDTAGTRSYGIFGINSGGTMQRFVRQNPGLGLTAKPGTAEFDAQWHDLVAKRPHKAVEAQLKFHERNVVRPAQRGLVTARLGRFSNDPRAIAFASDMVVQYGARGAQKHLNAAAGARTVEQFVDAASASMRSTLKTDFRTFLAQHPDRKRGLLNRIDKRATMAMSLSSDGRPINGNVPRWNGRLPDINDVPEYRERLDRVDGMIDSMGGTPSQRAAVRDHVRRQITRAWLSSIAQTNPSAAMAVLHSGKYDDALTLSDDVALRNQSESAWKGYETEIRAAHKQLLTNLQSETKALLSDEIASIRNTGQPTGLLTDAHRAMLSSADEENIALAKFEHGITKKIAGARNEELPGILEALEPEGDNFAIEQKKYEAAQKLVAQRLKAQAKDPAGYAVGANKALGDVWREAMLSNDPVKVQSAIQTLRAMQKEQGVPEERIRSLTQSSMAHNERLLKSAENADAAFANFMELRKLYGPEFAEVLDDMEDSGGPKGWHEVNQIADTGNIMLAKALARVVHAGEFKDDAELGVALALNGKQDVARQIFDGRVRRSEVKGLVPTGKSDDGDENMNQILQRVTGDTFSQTTSALNRVREAAVSHYAGTAALGAPLDGEAFEESIKAVSGGIVEHNGSGGTGRLVPPIAGMTQSQFDTAMQRVKDRDIKGAWIGYSEVPEPVTADMLRHQLQLVTIGNGTYQLRWPGAGLARDANGVAYEWNLGELLPELAERFVNKGGNVRKTVTKPGEPAVSVRERPFNPRRPQ